MTEKKGSTYHLNIVLTKHEADQLEEFTKGVYGAKSLLIRGLLNRFFRQQKEKAEKIKLFKEKNEKGG